MVRIGVGVAVSLAIVAGCTPTKPPPSDDLHPLEAYEGGAKQVEDQYVAFLAGFFGRDPAPGEPLLRGTHAVGTCTAATFEIDDLRARPDVPDDYAVGVFAAPASYDARVRFSNGLGAPADPSKGFDDKDYDARAMAVQIDYRDGQRQDFVLQNSPIFPIWPVEGFALVVQLGIARTQGQEEEFMAELSPDQQATLANVIALVKRYQREPGVVVPTFTLMPDAYRLETYWSGKAHQLGVKGVPVKYIAEPCAGNDAHVPTKGVDFGARSADFLQAELKRHIEQPRAGEEPACFHFYLQPLQADGMTGAEGQVLPAAAHWRWVEDTTLEWKESEAPAYRVGKITLRGPALPPAICDDPENFINSSINTLAEHQGLGRISRAEAVAAPASIARRTPN